MSDEIAECVSWVFSVLGPILVGLAGLWIGYRQYKKTLEARLKELERNEIYKKLNEFYGPLLQLRKRSNLLYAQFKNTLVSENPNFNTVAYLLEEKTLTSNQKAILTEILNIGKACEDLIDNKAGLIDDEVLRTDTIPNFMVHLLIIRLAYTGGLVGEASEFKKYSFPTELDEKLNGKIESLGSRLTELNNI